MKLIVAFVALASAFLASPTAALSLRGRDQDERKLTTYDYKYIETTDGKCWEPAQEGGYYYVYAKQCKYDNDPEYKQDWYYTKYGELKHRNYKDYCVTYDIYDAGSRHYEHLALVKCHGGANQKWNYIDYHFQSHYDGKCVDLDRQGGNKFHMKDCKKDLKDQEHKVEDYWFYGWS